MNLQFYQKQLADLKRSNKVRKLKLAERNGYSTIEDYKKALEDSIDGFLKTTKEEVKERKVIHNVIISDASGSMNGPKYECAINGIRIETDTLRSSSEIQYLHSLFEFVDRTHPLSIPYKDEENPKPSFTGAIGWNTPLWKSIVTVLNYFKHVPESEQVLVKIFTDGDNNAEGQYKNECKDLIKELNSKNFTITFVATKNDMSNIIREMDLDESNTLTVDNTGEGFEKAFSKSLEATRSYSSKVVKGEDVKFGFYKELI